MTRVWGTWAGVVASGAACARADALLVSTTKAVNNAQRSLFCGTWQDNSKQQARRRRPEKSRPSAGGQRGRATPVLELRQVTPSARTRSTAS